MDKEQKLAALAIKLADRYDAFIKSLNDYTYTTIIEDTNANKNKSLLDSIMKEIYEAQEETDLEDTEIHER